jgi:hypothetical protein
LQLNSPYLEADFRQSFSIPHILHSSSIIFCPYRSVARTKKKAGINADSLISKKFNGKYVSRTLHWGVVPSDENVFQAFTTHIRGIIPSLGLLGKGNSHIFSHFLTFLLIRALPVGSPEKLTEAGNSGLLEVFRESGGAYTTTKIAVPGYFHRFGCRAAA